MLLYYHWHRGICTVGAIDLYTGYLLGWGETHVGGRQRWRPDLSEPHVVCSTQMEVTQQQLDRGRRLERQRERQTKKQQNRETRDRRGEEKGKQKKQQRKETDEAKRKTSRRTAEQRDWQGEEKASRRNTRAERQNTGEVKRKASRRNSRARDKRLSRQARRRNSRHKNMHVTLAQACPYNACISLDSTLVVWYVSCWWLLLFTVFFYLLDAGILKPITVDGEKIMLRIADTAGEERFSTFDSNMLLHVNASVSWTFERCIKDSLNSFIHLYL